MVLSMVMTAKLKHLGFGTLKQVSLLLLMMTAPQSQRRYVRSLGLAGLFSWEIDADNGDILNAMHEGLAGGPLANRAPIANAGPDLNVVGPTKVVTTALHPRILMDLLKATYGSRQQERQ